MTIDYTRNFDKADKRVLALLETKINTKFPTENDYFNVLVDQYVIQENNKLVERWLTHFNCVIEINDNFIEFPFAYANNDDSSPFDEGWKLNWQHVKLVKPIEIKTVKYVPIE